MSIIFRKRVPIFPFTYLNLSKSGWSVSFKLGPFSWNSRRKRGRVDLPGPFSYETKGKE